MCLVPFVDLIDLLINVKPSLILALHFYILLIDIEVLGNEWENAPRPLH